MDNSTETYLLSSIEQIKKYKALADRRLVLLEKALLALRAEWTDDNPNGYMKRVTEEIIKMIEKELGE